MVYIHLLNPYCFGLCIHVGLIAEYGHNYLVSTFVYEDGVYNFIVEDDRTEISQLLYYMHLKRVMKSTDFEKV